MPNSRAICRHPGRAFASERLAIEFSLAGNNDVGFCNPCPQIDRFSDHVKARADLRAAEGDQAEPQTTRRARAGNVALIASKRPRRDVRQARQAGFEDFQLFGRRTLLRPKSARRADRTKKWVVYITSGRDGWKQQFVRQHDSRQFQQV